MSIKHPRGTTNKNVTGNSYARRARKAWLLVTFGDGFTAPCFYCDFELDWFTITVDRIIPGALGGSYRRNNIRPACMRCNSIEGSKLREDMKHGRIFLTPEGGVVVLPTPHQGLTRKQNQEMKGIPMSALTACLVPPLMEGSA